MWRDFKSRPRCYAQAFAEENLQTHGDQTPGEERFNLKLLFLFILIFFFGSRSIPQPLPVSVCVCVFDLAVGVVTPMSFGSSTISISCSSSSQSWELIQPSGAWSKLKQNFGGRAPLEANASYNYLSEVNVFHVLQVMFQRRS